MNVIEATMTDATTGAVADPAAPAARTARGRGRHAETVTAATTTTDVGTTTAVSADTTVGSARTTGATTTGKEGTNPARETAPNGTKTVLTAAAGAEALTITKTDRTTSKMIWFKAMLTQSINRATWSENNQTEWSGVISEVVEEYSHKLSKEFYIINARMQTNVS